jgi:pimeloyl-ACP methyl ester carboxylesterase
MRTMINGIQMAYTDEGDGIPLVFIHGFPLNRSTWSKQVEAFKSNYRVIAPDLRGLGETEATPGPASMSRFAEDLHALLHHLGTGPAILVGHSMGGYVALAFARAFPKALRALVLVGTKAGADSPAGADVRRVLAEKVQAEGTSVVVEAMAPKMLSASHTDAAMAASVKDFMTTASPEGVVSALLGMAERPDAGAWLGKIRVRTLVIVGAEDTVIPPSESEILMMGIPSAQLKIIPKAGHLVAFEEANAFNDALREWLAWGSSSRYSSMGEQKV